MILFIRSLDSNKIVLSHDPSANLKKGCKLSNLSGEFCIMLLEYVTYSYELVFKIGAVDKLCGVWEALVFKTPSREEELYIYDKGN